MLHHILSIVISTASIAVFILTDYDFYAFIGCLVAQVIVCLIMLDYIDKRLEKLQESADPQQDELERKKKAYHKLIDSYRKEVEEDNKRAKQRKDR